MKIFVLIMSTLAADLVFSEENKIPRSEHVKAFNEAQRCFNSTSARESSKKAQCAKDALEEGRFLFEPDSLNIAGLTYNYGKALKPRDRDKAHDVLGESLELYEALYGKSSVETINTLIEMGDAKDALKIARKYFDRNSLNYAGILLGLSMSDMIPSKDIVRYAGSAYEIFKKEGDPDSINTSLAGFQMAKVKMAQEKYRSAIPYLISATKNPSVAVYAHGWLIEAYDSIGEYDSGSFHAQELGRLTPGRENADLFPVFIKTAKYPSYARRIRKSGFVVLELTVTTSGNVSDLKVIEESPEGYDFAKSALKAAARLRYAPRFVNNEAQEVPGVLYKYNFKMAN